MSFAICLVASGTIKIAFFLGFCSNGICLSNRIKAVTTFSAVSGLDSKNASGNGTNTSNSNSKLLSASIPPTPQSEGEILQSSNLRSFSFGELQAATRNFHPDSVLGKGDFHSVFKGWFDEHTLAATKPGTGIVIAVKKLNLEGWQGHREWLDYNAKLADFGLARDGPTGDQSYVSNRVMGTCIYAAPEFLSTGHLTTKSDVYSFGVVLLEILSGKKAIDKNRPTGEQSLVDWAKPYLTNKCKVFRVLDTRLEGQYPLTHAVKVAILSLQCLSMDPKSRPTMDEVVTALEQLQQSKDVAKNDKK